MAMKGPGPSGERIAGYIYLGHPAADLVDRPRREIEAIATHWHGASSR